MPLINRSASERPSAEVRFGSRLLQRRVHRWNKPGVAKAAGAAPPLVAIGAATPAATAATPATLPKTMCVQRRFSMSWTTSSRSRASVLTVIAACLTASVRLRQGANLHQLLIEAVSERDHLLHGVSGGWTTLKQPVELLGEHILYELNTPRLV
jgi:hypothetical protein